MTRIDHGLARESMRQQRPRGTTTRDSVVSAALDVVDRVGSDGLTIRAVAALVGAPPMSLYTHFANKGELLDLMYVEISRRLYPDEVHPTWQTGLLALARHVRDTLLAHPRWTPLLARPAPPIAMPVRERILRQMVEAGMSSEGALRGMSAALVAAIGLSLVELTFLEPDGTSTFRRRFERQRSWLQTQQVPGVEPITREAFARVGVFEFETNFEFSITALLDGLEAGTRTR